MRRLLMIMIAVALTLPIVAQQEWQSTSAMKGAGSAYSSQITEVGAVTASEMATTTNSYSPAQAPSGPHRAKKGEPGVDDGSYKPNNPNFGPVGDALIPLMLMALGFGVYCAVRGRKERTPSK